MGYYQYKKQAQDAVYQLIKAADGKGVPKHYLYYQIANRFGFGDVWVDKYLKLLENNGIIDVATNSVRLVGVKE